MTILTSDRTAGRRLAYAALIASAVVLSAAAGCSTNPTGPSGPFALYVVDVEGFGDYVAIQDGLNAASDGDTVLVMPGRYAGPGNKNLDFNGVAIVLKGAGTRDLVVIDCEGQGRGICLVGGNSPVIENITIANGVAQGDTAQGGGMYVEGVSPALNSVRFLANSAGDEGGGLYCKSASPALYDVLFDDNVASTSGGAMMCVEGSSASLNRVYFYRNAAQGSGGAMGCIFSSPMLTECVFFRNSAFFGGGMYCGASDPLISSCTFAENEAAYAGGVYCWDYSEPSITKSIIAFSTSGEAILCNGYDPFINQCCIYGNEGGDELCGTYSTSMLYVDPLFCDLDARNLTLGSDSECLPWNNPWSVQIGAYGEGCFR
jgi:predicted outer membrane repeat protein